MKLVNSENIIKKPLAWLEISKKNLLYNIAQLKSLVRPSKIMAVVKANAYGAGILGVAKAIERSIDAFGVVGVAEAINLREAGILKPVVQLGIYCQEDAEKFIKNKISPTIFTLIAFKDYEIQSKKLKTKSSACIAIDTGLNRLAVPYQEALEFIKTVSKSKWVSIAGVFSTLTEDRAFDRIQRERFIQIKQTCEKANIQIPIWSLASSEGVFLFPEAHFDMVRVGITLLGFYPSKGAKAAQKISLRQAVTFKTKVGCVQELEKDESIYYRRKFIAKQKTRVAVLLPGYSYGLPAQMIRGGSVLIGNHRYPLVGGIGMTNCFVDIGNNKKIKAGDEASIDIQEACALLQQDEYEFLSRIPEKVTRVYV